MGADERPPQTQQLKEVFDYIHFTMIENAHDTEIHCVTALPF